MRTLLEIEEAIMRLPSEVQLQLIKDIPALCPDAFPRDGWAKILGDSVPRPAFSQMLDQIDSEYRHAPERFPILNEDSLEDKK
jgi:hypothetical protein